MTVGQVVDFCVEFNNRQYRREKQEQYEAKHGTKRKATQNDINAFFG